jgi:hypothetical protein
MLEEGMIYVLDEGVHDMLEEGIIYLTKELYA